MMHRRRWGVAAKDVKLRVIHAGFCDYFTYLRSYDIKHGLGIEKSLK